MPVSQVAVISPSSTPRRLGRRRGLGLLLTVVLMAPLLSVATASPAQAECSSIPADRDVAVTRKVYEVGQRLGVNDKVMLSAFETGWVESHMNNLPCGDRDSLGVFQQRPSQGWGTPEQIRNVDFASNSYFQQAIVNDRNNPGYTPGQLAQSVQRSAFPDRYDASEAKARQMMDEAFQPYGTIGAKWRAAGGAGSDVGNPVRAEEAAKLGGRFQEFERGMIIWNSANNEAWMVHGAILTAYRDNGSEEAWGFPIMDEHDASPAPDGTTGRFQKFDGALILWSATTGAHIVHGAIRDFYVDGGYETTYGYPTSDEIPDGDGFKQNFQQGSIHWNPTDGARWEPTA